MSALDTLREEWAVRHDGVSLERQDVIAGWAVFSGCDGEEPHMVAFFPGHGALAMADALLAATEDDGEGERTPVVLDGAREPALLTLTHGLVIANHCPDEEAIAALCDLFGRQPSEWT